MKITNTPEVAAQHATSHVAGGTDIVDHSLLASLEVGDPHSQYQKESEKNAANGYAPLDATTRVPKVNTPSDTVFTDDTQTLINKTLNDTTNTIHACGVHAKIRNESGVTMVVGAVVYPTGFNVGQERTLVSLADADNSAAMPASGIVAEADIANNANGVSLSDGVITGMDTSAWAVGDQLYVSTTAGVLTSTKPTGVSEEIQAVATVTRANASVGVIQVHISGHSHEFPNSVLPSAQLPAATESVVGALEVATDAEVAARTDDGKIITPAKLPVHGSGVSGIITYIAQTIYGNKTLTGNTRIGSTGTAEAVLHAVVSELPSFTPPAAVDFMIERNGAANIQIAGADASWNQMTFSSPATSGAYGALLRWQYSALLMTLGTAVTGADLRFVTGLLAEAMRITAAGNVGIGGTPEVPLHVVSSLAWTPPAGTAFAIERNGGCSVVIASADASVGQLVFSSPANTGDLAALLRWDYTNGMMTMGPANTGNELRFMSGAFAERMRIDSAGQVGIGTATPGYILDVYHASEKVNSQNGYLTNGADFGEYFESVDGNNIPFGVSVVLENDKIRPALAGETPIGVISATCSYVGNNGGSEWPEKHLRDEFGKPIIEDYTETVTKERQVMDEVDLYDEDVTAPRRGSGASYHGMFEPEPRKPGRVIGKHKVPRTVETVETEKVTELVDGRYIQHEVERTVTKPVMENYEETKTGKRAVINPAFDPSRGDYVRREDRDEWNVVGLLGQVRILKGQPVDPRWVKLKDINASGASYQNVELWLVK